MQDLADPHARERALAVASQDPPSAPDEAVVEVRDVLASIGDTCPEYPPDCGRLRAARNRSGSTVEQSKKWRAAHRAHAVGSDGHFVGFEPLLATAPRSPSSGPTALLGHGARPR